MGEDELDRHCIVRILMHEGSRGKTPGTHWSSSLPSSGNRCKFLPYGQRLPSGPVSVCVMSAAKEASSAFGMLARNLEHLESISDTLRQPDHPSPQIPVCVNRTMSFQCDGNPRPKQAPAMSKYIRLNSLQRWVGSQKNNLVELLKETHPSWWSSNCPHHQTFGKCYWGQPFHQATLF